MSVAPVADTRFAERRRRAGELCRRYPFAAEVLRLYAGLLDVHERAFADCPALPDTAAVAAHAVAAVLPAVVEATVAAGPEQLVEQARERMAGGALVDMVRAWLDGEVQTPLDRYLARAAATPLLEAAADGLPRPADPGDRRCPCCGGPPMLAVVEPPAEALVGSRRRLVCSRCLRSWAYARMVCAGCGETRTDRMPIYEEGDWIPHARVEACETCSRYLICVDLRRDAAAVAPVDELAAMPLSLHAESLGFVKIAPNLMGL